MQKYIYSDYKSFNNNKKGCFKTGLNSFNKLKQQFLKHDILNASMVCKNFIELYKQSKLTQINHSNLDEETIWWKLICTNKSV